MKIKKSIKKAFSKKRLKEAIKATADWAEQLNKTAAKLGKTNDDIRYIKAHEDIVTLQPTVEFHMFTHAELKKAYRKWLVEYRLYPASMADVSNLSVDEAAELNANALLDYLKKGKK